MGTSIGANQVCSSATATNAIYRKCTIGSWPKAGADNQTKKVKLMPYHMNSPATPINMAYIIQSFINTSIIQILRRILPRQHRDFLRRGASPTSLKTGNKTTTAARQISECIVLSLDSRAPSFARFDDGGIKYHRCYRGLWKDLLSHGRHCPASPYPASTS